MAAKAVNHDYKHDRRKKKMKTRLLSILIMTILVIGMLPLAFANDDEVEVRDSIRLDADTVRAERDFKAKLSDDELRMRIKERIGTINDFEACVRKASAAFPDVEKTRIVEKCKQIATVAPVIRGGLKDRPYLRETLQQATPEAKLRILDRLVSANKNVEGFFSNLSEEDAKKFLALDRARQKKVLEEGENSLDKYKLKKVELKTTFKKREVAQKKLLEAEKRYKKATEKYEKAKRDYKFAKQKFDDAVKEGDEDSAKEHAKEFLLHAADMVIEALEKVKEKAESSDDLTQTEVDEIVADVNAKIAEMEEAKAAVETAETKEEIKEAGKKIIKAWKRVKHKLKVHAANIIKGKVGEIIKRSESLEKKLDRTLAYMEEHNISVGELDEKVDKFSSLVDEARELFKAGIEIRDDNPDEAKEKIKDAHEKLKDAHKVLMELVREIKAKGGDLDDDHEDDEDDEEYEIEEEYEDDDEEFEIKVEIRDFETKVKIEQFGVEEEFTLDTTDESVILDEIADRLGMNIDEFESIIEWEVNEVDDEEDEEGSDETDDDDSGEINETTDDNDSNDINETTDDNDIGINTTIDDDTSTNSTDNSTDTNPTI